MITSYNDFEKTVIESASLFIMIYNFEKRCDIWYPEDEKIFKLKLSEFKSMINDMQNHPEFILKYKFNNQASSQISEFINEAELFIAQWEKYFILFNELKTFNGEIQESHGIVNYLNKLTSLNEQQLCQLVKHEDILKEYKTKVTEYFKRELPKVGLSWSKIDNELNKNYQLKI